MYLISKKLARGLRKFYKCVNHTQFSDFVLLQAFIVPFLGITVIPNFMGPHLEYFALFIFNNLTNFFLIFIQGAFQRNVHGTLFQREYQAMRRSCGLEHAAH